MSGDTQPRKRKDKKRKKDEGIEHLSPTFTTSKGEVDETAFHVHKEGGTGGGICAKIIFFILFSALIVLVGLIITEHRGLTDLDTADTESRFSGMFEGWIDDSPSHEEEDHLSHALEDDHDDDDADHEDHDVSTGHDDDEDDHDDDHDDGDEEEEEADDEADTDKASGEDEEEEEEEEVGDEDQASPEVEEDEEDEEQEEEGDTGEAADDEEDEEEEDEEEGDVVDEASDEQAVDDDDDDEGDNEADDDQDEEGDQEDDQGDGDDDEEEAASPEQVSAERRDRSAEDEDDVEAGDDDEGEEEEQDTPDQDEADLDEGYESEEKVEKVVVKKVADSKEKKSKKPKSAEVKDAGEGEQTPMVIKVGVGMAILVVAYVVLVRKRRPAPTEDTSSEDVPVDLTRRNTIVVPPTLQEVVQDIEQDIEEDSDEEGETESEEEDDDVKPKSKSRKAKYQELRSTYTRSLTPESEPEYSPKKTSAVEEYEHDGEDEEEEEEEEDEGEEEEEEVEAEEEEEEESGEGDDEGELVSEDEADGEDDDEELLKRLEQKYGKIKKVNTGTEDKSDGSDSDNNAYPYANVTNEYDWEIKENIDNAQDALNNNPVHALTLFDALLKTYPFSPRSLYGKAQALDKLADVKRSNQLLQQSIDAYMQLLNAKDVPDVLILVASERCINRMRFSGNYKNLLTVHKILIDRFNDDPKHQNDLAVTYLTINRINAARRTLMEILARWPDDGFALVHYGFILKTADNNLIEAIGYMQKGIASKASGVVDGRFYFHLGDALARLGRTQEAMDLYEEGVQNGLFRSKYQRSLYNVERLTAKPWWKKSDLRYKTLIDSLEQNYEAIYNEGSALLSKKGFFEDESENLKDKGDWKQFELYARGKKNTENCKRCPVTCRIIDTFPEASSCKRGQTKFSVMHPGTHVWPHCGPTNCRLRIHLGLKVPPKTFIRVANDTRSWEEGKVFIFDDSFEHEVWHNGTEFRLVLIVDVWHPELTQTERRSLSPI